MESTPKLCACGCLGEVKPERTYLPSHQNSLSTAERFWSKVNKTDTCWLWTAGMARDGYGFFWHDGKNRGAHRIAYSLANGPIPEGLLIDHACGVRSCVNPSHLRLADKSKNAENLTKIRADNTSGFRGVTFCKQNNRWRSQVSHNGKRYYGGFFEDVEEAAEASRLLRIKLFTHNVIDRSAD